MALRTAAAAFICLSFCALPVQAALTISNHRTQHVSCVAGVCQATAPTASLNAAALTGMLFTGDVTLVSGNIAGDIVVAGLVHWQTASRLTLDSQHAITFRKSIVVIGPGGLTLTTNDGGSGGTVRFEGMAHVEFQDPAGALTIDGAPYTLVRTVAALASGIAGDPAGHFALAQNYNARNDGTYAQSPIATSFHGHLQGLGNTIANVRVLNADDNSFVGFFADNEGTVEGLNLRNAWVGNSGFRATIGGLAGENGGTIRNASVTGAVNSFRARTGGFVGSNDGTIDLCQSSVAVSGYLNYIAGFAGFNGGHISRSFSSGSVMGRNSHAGGFVGLNRADIETSYSNASVAADGGDANGLVAFNQGEAAFLMTSYAAGPLTGPDGHVLGIGRDSGETFDTYWDTTTTGTTEAVQGRGANPNDVRGLTDAEFKAGLPSGFDPAVWAEDPAINDGLPHLIANLPH